MAFSGSSALLLVLLGFAVGAFGTMVGAGGGFILAPVMLGLEAGGHPRASERAWSLFPMRSVEAAAGLG